jgi:hypothetical protein
MIYAILGILLVLLIYLPQIWVQYIMRHYAREIKGMPGTGGELAKHLVDVYQLNDVIVEETQPGQDHFDPQAKAVRLSPDNYHGRSLTAVAVAAHEVGHAIQFHRQEPVSQLRGRYIPTAIIIKKLGIGALMFMPVVTGIIHVPQVAILLTLAGVLAMIVSALVYLIILPEELDASFNKALPMLIKGEYIQTQQEQAIRKVLQAAALTYFAAALADVFRLWRWIGYLRMLR